MDQGCVLAVASSWIEHMLRLKRAIWSGMRLTDAARNEEEEVLAFTHSCQRRKNP